MLTTKQSIGMMIFMFFIVFTVFICPTCNTLKLINKIARYSQSYIVLMAYYVRANGLSLHCIEIELISGFLLNLLC